MNNNENNNNNSNSNSKSNNEKEKEKKKEKKTEQRSFLPFTQKYNCSLSTITSIIPFYRSTLLLDNCVLYCIYRILNSRLCDQVLFIMIIYYYSYDLYTRTSSRVGVGTE